MKTVEVRRVAVGLHNKLVKELEGLKRMLDMGHELTVEWLPGQNEKLCGEVTGNCIYVYDEDEKAALETLKHEFLDYILSKVVEPYEKVANQLIGIINEEAYRRKERLIEVLSALL